MIFLAVLLFATAVAGVVLRHTGDRRLIARWGLGAAFAVAGVTHLVNPTPFEQHLPDWVPAATALVFATGLLEIALGCALVLPRLPTRRIGQATAAYLVAVLPANIYVAVAQVEVDGQPGGIYPWLRLPLQLLFIAWALWSTSTMDSATGLVESAEAPLRR